ncbi:MAG: hypothetical protein K1W34_13935 [Lachnospiraceae bacterium]
MKENERIKRAEVIEVVRVLVREGEGTENSPVKLVEQYWGKNGQYIGKIDVIQSR